MVATITTPAKWQELFAKAVREGVQVRQLGSGQWVATSGTDNAKAYAVSLHACECPGHEYHGRCKHRAALAFRLGVLTIGLDPEPPTPAAPALAVVPPFCVPCDGKGCLVKLSATFGTTYRVTCRACSGAGIARKEAPARIAA
jgi:hypothetical protein